MYVWDENHAGNIEKSYQQYCHVGKNSHILLKIKVKNSRRAEQSTSKKNMQV